jgi:hypothetical protein
MEMPMKSRRSYSSASLRGLSEECFHELVINSAGKTTQLLLIRQVQSFERISIGFSKFEIYFEKVAVCILAPDNKPRHWMTGSSRSHRSWFQIVVDIS